MGQIFTFYSYKGGVGRSMALANIAVILSKLGNNVLIIDWDLEASGLEYFFKDFINIKQVKQKTGIMDLLHEFQTKSDQKVNWQKSLIDIKIPKIKQKIQLITSGKKDSKYYNKVRLFDIKKIYNKSGFSIETMRNEWKKEYDFILIDSRTGITDFGGICTIHLPDILVLFYVSSNQSLNGIIEVAKKASNGRKKLPFDRKSLISLPILSRFDSSEEFEVSQFWINDSAKRLINIYSNWLPNSLSIQEFIEITKLPYIPYFSFGEKLAVIDYSTKDPVSLGYSYETICALIATNLQSVENVLINRDEYIRSMDKNLILKRNSQKINSKIFISYVHEDIEKAKLFFEKLQVAGFDPWLDYHKLTGGEDWQNSINDAIHNSDLFLVLLTNTSVAKGGLFQEENKTALKVIQSRIDKDVFIIPVRLDDCKVPDQLSNYHYLDFSKNIDWEKLIVTIMANKKKDYETNQKIIEKKWLDLLEENNDIKIKRQIHNQKENIEYSFNEILELDGNPTSQNLYQKFWDTIDNICIQILVLISYDTFQYKKNLLDLLYHAYHLTAGPNPKQSSDHAKGKQAEIWIGIIIRIYLIGAIALKTGKYDFIKDLIIVRIKWSKYWSTRFWIRHGFTMYARSVSNSPKKEGLVSITNSFISKIKWAQKYFDTGSDDALEYIGSFDLIQCNIAFSDSNDINSCYPSFGQFYNRNIDNTLIDIVSKRNSYSIISDIPDKEIAYILSELDILAGNLFASYAGWNSHNYPEDVKNFINSNLKNGLSKS